MVQTCFRAIGIIDQQDVVQQDEVIAAGARRQANVPRRHGLAA
jgi:hypothetical protein